VKGIAFMEAVVRPLTWDEWPHSVRALFQQFRTPEVGWDLIVNNHVFVEQVLPGAIERTLAPEEMDRYREPYRDPASRTPVWRWPNEIPIDGEPADVVEIVQAYADWLGRSTMPKLLLFAQPGAILRANMVEWCQAHVAALESVDIGPGRHFVQEDRPHEIGRALRGWYERIGQGEMG
jgi:haloalkane dehalogenase